MCYMINIHAGVGRYDGFRMPGPGLIPHIGTMCVRPISGIDISGIVLHAT